MHTAVIDAREWQNTFDLQTGQKVESETASARLAGEVLADHPYPGDVDSLSNKWVTDTALDLIGRYDPGFVCLSYAQQYFKDRFFPLSERERADMFDAVFEEAERFIEASGYTPVLVGSGNMTPLFGEIDLTRLDGLAVTGNWAARYAGLHKPSKNDLEYIRSIPEIEQIITKQEWIDLFNGVKSTTCDIDLLPDYLVTAQKGWTYRTFGTTLRKPVRIPGDSKTVPVYSPLGHIDDIRAIRPLIENNLPDTKIALIMIEGIGEEHFPAPFSRCQNGEDWFWYESGEGQYLTITTGSHQVFAYPVGYRYFDVNTDEKGFPFSGYFIEVPEDTIGNSYKGKSIAVGNRSMYMHMVFGADISIECFARNLYNQGCLAVISDDTER